MDAPTIIALATPPGAGALALLRLSGPEATALTDRLLRRPVSWEPRRLWHRELHDGEILLDDVVLSYWRGPRSYTGEDVVEISCHGNPFLVRRVLDAYLRLGAKPAGPGEFTQRAFLNGKVDLTQAEAVADLIAAATDREIAGAQALQAGRLGAMLQEARAALIDLLANLEAYIDFPDEDISPETGSAFAARVEALRAAVARLLETAPLGRILREGIVTAIVGRPNVGKSSLFNALLREDRAIVSPQPGTTRDVLETETRVGPWRLRLLDTAGRRATDDPIEAEGVRRAAAAAERADLVIHLVEASSPAPEDYAPAPGQRVLRIAAKADLGVAPENAALPRLSLRTGEGLDTLPGWIEAALVADGRPLSSLDGITVNGRQEAALRAAEAALSRAHAGLLAHDAPELTSLALREALRAAGEVVGVATDEEILDALFLKFCIGK
ncbi:MAG: tRNA uridine-5-carboxymethylaminomethyl(34) synthesis GTPase MnmE [Verrucomicrobium sp.]|nr:tRNA uridine-5-carboxymethylaminomethyl(34) synthesis GTPase MnmE [Verrucomicrobium sp.]